MSVIGSTQAATAAQTENTNTTARAKLSSNFDTFLTLLTSQLANQDPLNPVDSAAFTQQLVQYSQVEQQISTNDKLASLLTQNQATGSAAAVSFIGKSAVFTSDISRLSNGSAKWTYDLTGATGDARFSVRDSKGREVYSETRTAESGAKAFEWNGKDSLGRPLADGAYQLTISATDSTGAKVTGNITVEEAITGIDFSNPSAATVITATGARTFDSVHSVKN